MSPCPKLNFSASALAKSRPLLLFKTDPGNASLSLRWTFSVLWHSGKRDDARLRCLSLPNQTATLGEMEARALSAFVLKKDAICSKTWNCSDDSHPVDCLSAADRPAVGIGRRLGSLA
jgi:hypothetical protein